MQTIALCIQEGHYKTGERELHIIHSMVVIMTTDNYVISGARSIYSELLMHAGAVFSA